MDLQLQCLDGLILASEERARTASFKPITFDEHILRYMGEGIADVFMRPYNFRVWGVPTTEVSPSWLAEADYQMQCKWLGERVAAPSLRQVVRRVVTKEEAGNWGPNATFKFAKRGGTGGIWTAIAETIPAKKMRLGGHGAVERILPSDKMVRLANGRSVRYKHLISTMPLDGFLEGMDMRTDAETQALNQMKAAAKGLVFSSTIIIGLGMRGVRPSRIGDKCKFPLEDATDYQAGCTSQKMTRRIIGPRFFPITPHTTHQTPPYLYLLYSSPIRRSRMTLTRPRARTGASCSRSANLRKSLST
jgi:hypothetical protein